MVGNNLSTALNGEISGERLQKGQLSLHMDIISNSIKGDDVWVSPSTSLNKSKRKSEL
jgi:hypothetical protein